MGLEWVGRTDLERRDGVTKADAWPCETDETKIITYYYISAQQITIIKIVGISVSTCRKQKKQKQKKTCAGLEAGEGLISESASSRIWGSPRSGSYCVFFFLKKTKKTQSLRRKDQRRMFFTGLMYLYRLAWLGFELCVYLWFCRDWDHPRAWGWVWVSPRGFSSYFCSRKKRVSCFAIDTYSRSEFSGLSLHSLTVCTIHDVAYNKQRPAPGTLTTPPCIDDSRWRAPGGTCRKGEPNIGCLRFEHFLSANRELRCTHFWVWDVSTPENANLLIFHLVLAKDNPKKRVLCW